MNVGPKSTKHCPERHQEKTYQTNLHPNCGNHSPDCPSMVIIADNDIWKQTKWDTTQKMTIWLLNPISNGPVHPNHEFMPWPMGSFPQEHFSKSTRHGRIIAEQWNGRHLLTCVIQETQQVAIGICVLYIYAYKCVRTWLCMPVSCECTPTLHWRRSMMSVANNCLLLLDAFFQGPHLEKSMTFNVIRGNPVCTNTRCHSAQGSQLPALT